MDFLLTVIGNAAVDFEFRDRLLLNPVETINAWGLRLTKGEVELMEEMFGSRTEDLKKTFQALEDVLYENLGQPKIGKCNKPCRMTIFRPNPLPTVKPKKVKAA
jgi:hypothetical protein